ncbi:MAG: DUF2231 domain-containing protein [bacterium]|nr:DUF2231 domain-containing protein [bacterium]
MAVHLPVAALVLVAVCDILAIVLRRPEGMRESALLLSIVGVLGAIGAVVTGSSVEANVLQNPAVSALLERHESLGYATMWVAIGMLVLRLTILFVPKLERFRNSVIIISVAGALLVSIAGHYGGELVYRYGANTLPVNQAATNAPTVVDDDGK